MMGSNNFNFPHDHILDPKIAPYVRELQAHGIETTESCQGGEGHCFPEPTIKFDGQRDQGWKALHIAQERGWPVSALRRVWQLKDTKVRQMDKPSRTE